jgi:hypothetical protein
MYRLLPSIMVLVTLLIVVTPIKGQGDKIVFYIGNIDINNTTYRFVISEEYEEKDISYRVFLDPENLTTHQMSGVRHSDGVWGEMRFCAPHPSLSFESGCVMNGKTTRVWTGQNMAEASLDYDQTIFLLGTLNMTIEHGLKEEYRVSL